MRVATIPCLNDNYAYLLIDDDNRGVVIDPSEAPPVEAALEREGVELSAIWLTHHHYDHVGGVQALVETHGPLPVLGSAYDMEHGRIPCQSRGLSEGDTLDFAGLPVELLEIPGHTLGAIAYVVDGCVFSGDTLFIAGCGRVFEGTMPMMQTSMAKLRALPASTRIYCGHEYTQKNLEFAQNIEPDNAAIDARTRWANELRAAGETTMGGLLGDELDTNPFLRWDAETVISRAQRDGADADPGAVFGAIRKAKDRF
ncbi:MAG: hydroxyacylglutathione hydrolase [Myxococcales bacterium]|nr:hydroxyacylglutathione hydrolase [Myxococcales bacterium]